MQSRRRIVAASLAASLILILWAGVACGKDESVPLRVARAPTASPGSTVAPAPSTRAPARSDAGVGGGGPEATQVPILTPLPGGPLVECEVYLGGDRMQANASWMNLPSEQEGADRVGYDYVWHQPARDGSYTENRFRLTGDHQGTSLLGQSIPAGATLEFSVRPVFSGNVAGDYLRVQCAETEF